MVIPIPDGLAETAARDLASDARRLGARAMILAVAAKHGEASKKDTEEYEMIVGQIRSMCDIVCFCVDTKKEFRVGDYITPNTEYAMLQRKRFALADSLRLARWLH